MKYLISISKNVFINKLDDIVNKYNNTYYITIKMKSSDVKWSRYLTLTKKIITKFLSFKLTIM